MLVEMTMTPDEVRATTFDTVSRYRRGYDADEVDAFVESVASRLTTRQGLTSNDVYHVSFTRSRIGGRGYAEGGVDAFLDRIHAELALREESWGHPAATGEPVPLPADGEAMAEIGVPGSDTESNSDTNTGTGSNTGSADIGANADGAAADSAADGREPTPGAG